MTTNVNWAQREALVRLVRKGQIKSSRERRSEIETLHGLGWIEPRLGSKTLYVPTPAGLDNLRQRLAFVWPDWEEEVEAAVARGADPLLSVTYVRDVRIVRLTLDVDELDETMLFVLENALKKLGRAEGGVQLRVTDYSENQLSVAITYPSPPSGAAVEAQVARLRQQLRAMSARLHQQATVIAELHAKIAEARDFVLHGGASPVEGRANLLLLSVAGFRDLDRQRAQATANLVRSVLYSAGHAPDDALVMATALGPLVATNSANLAAEAAFRARDVLRALGVPASAALSRGNVIVETSDTPTPTSALVGIDQLELKRLDRLSRGSDDVMATAAFAGRSDLDSTRYRVSAVPNSSTREDAAFIIRNLANL